MSNISRDQDHGVAMASGFFRIVLYIGIIVLVIWLGRSSYRFGYDIFNQQAISPGDGQEITVVIKEGASVYDIGKTLKKKGLIEDAKVFYVQEKLSVYKGRLKPGTYILSTAFTPDQIMAVLSGEQEDESSEEEEAW